MTLVPEPRPCLRVYMNALYQQRELDHFPEVDEICKVDSSNADVTAFVQEIEIMKFIGKHENVIRLHATSIHNSLIRIGFHPLMMIDYLRQNCSWFAIQPRSKVESVLLVLCSSSCQWHGLPRLHGRSCSSKVDGAGVHFPKGLHRITRHMLSTASRDVASTTSTATGLDRWLLCPCAFPPYLSYSYSHQLFPIPYPLCNQSSRPFKFDLIQSYPFSFAQLLVSFPKVIRELKLSEFGCCNFYLCGANILHKGDDRCKTVAPTVVTLHHPAQHRSKC
uniref:PK_Tyr_Ser-Thr domain-containing protein n=1 Tax=Echinococcus granulosus TaxID=6210 RepID=A0A068WJR4_ECHGR|nr:hypothetical protein EgrG_000651000 [Echinococcus granulosus]